MTPKKKVLRDYLHMMGNPDTPHRQIRHTLAKRHNVSESYIKTILPSPIKCRELEIPMETQDPNRNLYRRNGEVLS